jgi:hypothetical protein
VNYLKRFRVLPGTRVWLGDIDPRFKDHDESQDSAAPEIEHYRARLRQMQELRDAELCLRLGRSLALPIC